MYFAHLFTKLVRLSAMNELQYRANFFIEMFNSLLNLGVGLTGLELVFYHTSTLAGWSRAELLVVVGVHVLIGGLINVFIQPSMYTLVDAVRDGTLDFTLIRPVNSQFLVSLWAIQIWRTVDILIGLAVLGYAGVLLGSQIGLAEALVFVLTVVCGGLTLYGIYLMLGTTAFWWVQIDDTFRVFESFYQAGRWPVGIYPDWLRWGLTFLVPVAFAVTVPAEALTGRLTPTTLLALGAVTAVVLIVSHWFWRIGLRSYTGASA